MGLIPHQALCNAISGDLAIRGRGPVIPEWTKTVQHEASAANGDAMRLIVQDARADGRLLGSSGADLNIDDGALREECKEHIRRCGERLVTAGEWWQDAAHPQILDGSIVRADEAAGLYFSSLVSGFNQHVRFRRVHK